ncbi:DUF4405 domain-containing protein [Rhizobium sp. ACO-34A]|nr:DUF4405 domain-containing protein [Rhizobium sp. ACO-34A]ATN34795.1 DUF4405 domain-containing protein [Rhizobium sp. ACO-34A]
MPALLSRYATPFITGLFLVSLISGIALFFHVGSAAFRGMHEWLSMVLFLPFVLHTWKNWRPFMMYFKRLPMAIALGVCLVAGIIFAWPAMTGTGNAPRGNPAIAMARIVTGGTPAQVAPLLGHTEESLVASLKEKGFNAAESGRKLSEIASASGKEPMSMMATLASLQTGQ